MTMNGIDIASYQKGIDLGKVPCDFVIVKATQDAGYVNPYCDAWVQQAINLGKCWGVLHYIGGQGAVAEADYFVDNIKGYLGKGLLTVDWEEIQNSAWGNYSYLDALVARVIERTGINPLIYAQASVYNQVAAVAKKHDCGLWIAQYANDKPTGYQAAPWNEGKYTCTIRQYSSVGRLSGWGGNLDLNKFYGNASAWAKYAGASTTTAPAPSAPAAPAAPTIPQITVDGIIGTATVKRWQQVMGTTQDGVISNQLNVTYRPALKAVNHNKPYGLSTLVKAVQHTLGVTVDGLLGPATIKAMQRRLGVMVDGILGPNTAKALQKRLNANTF